MAQAHHDNDTLESAEDTLSEYGAVRPDQLSAPSKLEFKPWHKPRKQYIRLNQWCGEIQALLKNADFQDENKVLRYLSLPSEDMLDIRTLASTLQDDIKLKYFGFCYTEAGSADDLRMNVSEKAIKSLANIDETSYVARNMLEDTGDKKSHAYKELAAHAPYHVVNIDLCNHFAAPRRATAYACADALHSIAHIQHLKTGGRQWLLFLTTRIQPDYFDVRHLQKFIAAIQDNVSCSDDFKTKLGEVFKQESDELLANLNNLADALQKTEPSQRKKLGLSSDEAESIRQDAANLIGNDAFRKFFCVGFGKWLLSFMAASSPQTKVEMLPSYFYNIAGEGQDMLSLAFLCTPQIQLPQDKYALVGPQREQGKQRLDEPKLGIKIVQASSRLTDLDEILAESPEKMEAMIKISMSLLEQADYDTSQYRDFANANGQSLTT